MLPPTNASPDAHPETPQELTADSLRLLGSTTVPGTFYGFVTVCAGVCTYRIWSSRKLVGRSTSRTASQLSFVAVLWLCGTIAISGMAQEVVTIYVRHRLFEPGPYAYVNFNIPSALVVDVTYYVSMVIADGVMIWRFKVIWHQWPLRRALLGMILLIYALSMVASVVALMAASGHCTRCPQIMAHGIELGIVSSVVLNVLITGLISGKLYKFRNFVRSSLSHSASRYANVAVMFVESCALYTIFSLLFVIFNAMNTWIQPLAPLLVVFRLSGGSTWDEEQDTRGGANINGHSTLQFSRVALGELRSEGNDHDHGQGAEEVARSG
ncbi:hypothetical protein CONPUDRAFT_144292 [Coniophora puteana RWD-64-598 SS2]|uniref:Uncharacterized protein n=1 Tax=Coniophora puteana (strain RWD-64-598) TaxID=741705 RepID=A0A5M3MQX3_CONPW|nr:uncharacterized protein CONPUDRAFT_144292 [Coniophora puteana RWD-64-598 SS2]EIW81572.1 hypothetical protein CONPUDRAFT_144292 [Coniophora puteana RWD-64-598 SS2]